MRLLFVLLIFLTSSCLNKDAKLQLLSGTNGIEKYGEKYYINEISDIQFSDSIYYVVDEKITSLFLLDKDLKFITSIGSRGKGPQEFLSMGTVAITSNKIYIPDVQKNSLMCYDKKGRKFLKKIILPKNIYLNFGDFFVDEDENVTVSYISKESIKIGTYNLNTNEFRPFDIMLDNPKKARLYEFVGSRDREFIIVLSRYSSKIYFVSKNYQIKEFLVNIPKKSMLKWEKLIKTGKNVQLITDGCIHKNTLYLVYQDFANSSRGLATLELSPNLDVLDVEFSLFPKSNGDDCISVNDNEIITFSRRKGAIQKYSNFIN